MIKRILSTAAAVFVAGTLSWATNLPLFTTAGSGCNEASQLLNCMNQLVQSINANTGVVAVSTSAFGTPATTTETTLQSITVNSNTLSAPGQSLRARCFGTFGSNTNNKTVKLMLTSTTTQ